MKSHNDNCLAGQRAALRMQGELQSHVNAWCKRILQTHPYAMTDDVLPRKRGV
jgi:hypothetical protein